MSWLHYLLEANLYLGVFYIGYYLFLSRETHYTLNRAYLLFSSVVSFILPVLQLGILKPAEPVSTVNYTFEPQGGAFTQLTTAVPAAPVFTWQDGIVYVYLAGAIILSLVLMIKLFQLIKLTRKSNHKADNNYKVVYLNDSDTAFSFFNFLFLGTKAQGSDTIIRHELVHIRQKHSVDIVFIELLKIINWFNPFIYLLQYSLKALHEYIADEKTTQAGVDAHTYSSFLVNNAYGLSGSSITHSFFNYNLLKKRIIMLHQKRSGNLARLKYLLAVPICGGLLCASTLSFSKTYGWVDIGPHRINKANTSPQVAEPVKRLLVTKNGISTVTDKFSLKRSDGTNRNYTAYNLSNKDKVDLKAKGIIVNVISNVKIDTIKHKIAPPPPAPPARGVDNRPPPPPPAPPVKHLVTKTGYKYEETGYLIDGKTNFRVIITGKNGTQKAYFKNNATVADIKLLKEKYGYTFPTMAIYPKMPPPPPEPPASAIDKRPPPPSPAPPANGQQVTSMDNMPDDVKLSGIELSKKRPSDFVAGQNKMIVINGTIYYITGKAPIGQTLCLTATDSTAVYKNEQIAINKYGEDAKGGVIALYGHVSFAIVPDRSKLN